MEENKQLSQEEYLEYIENWKVENEELIESGKCRKVFLECLLSCTIKVNGNEYNMNWALCEKRDIYFIYEYIEGSIFIKKYTKKGQKLLIIYNGIEYSIATSTFKRGALGNVLGIINHDYLYNIGEIIETKTGKIRILEQIRVKQKNDTIRGYKYLCLECGYIGECRESNLNLNNQGCPICCGQRVEIGINSIVTTAPWMIRYFVGGYEEAKLYTKSSGKSITPLCPDCGRIKSKKMKICDIYKRHDIHCSCSDKQPYPQKLMFSILEQLGLDFETEKVFDWCRYVFKGKEKQGRYDFVLNNHNVIIETDGGFHRKDNKRSGQTAEDSKFIDDEKDRLAIEHGVENIIRIDCDYGSQDRLEYMKQNILNNIMLNKLFDLSKIDWNKAEEFTCGNLIKQACNIKKLNPEFTTFDIGKIMKYSHTTITRWLTDGHKYGWCEYDTRKIMKDIGKKNGKLSSREIICTTTGEKFKSIEYCSTNSFKIFGVKIDRTNISAVCRGVRNHTQGYHFQFVEESKEESIKIKARKEKLKLNKEKVKPIICLNNGILISSVTKCEKDSEELFGVKLAYPSIYKICNNQGRKQTKGFVFKYIQDLTKEEYIKYDIDNKLKQIQENEKLNQAV